MDSRFIPDFQALKSHHRACELELAEISASDPNCTDKAAQDRFEEAVELHCEALDAFMLTPAPDLAGLRDKLSAFARHDLAAGWRHGQQIADLLAADAERLITWGITE